MTADPIVADSSADRLRGVRDCHRHLRGKCPPQPVLFATLSSHKNTGHAQHTRAVENGRSDRRRCDSHSRSLKKRRQGAVPPSSIH